MTLPLPELLRTLIHPAQEPVELAIFGTTDPDALSSMIATCAAEMGVDVAAGEFFHASSGCVVGLRLTDGSVAVLKAYQSHWEERFLRGVQVGQRTASAAGYPCPAPLAAPTPLGNGMAMLESYLPDPGRSLTTLPHAMEASAAGLVSLIACLQDAPSAGLDDHPFRKEEGELYSTPHNPIFDFPGTAEGAEWIDDWATRAHEAQSSVDLPTVTAHLDWSANNVRWDGSGVTAVYDWDSLSVTPAAVAAGQAAAVWRSTGESSDTDGPSTEEIHRYLNAFCRARDTEFSPEEVRVACASAVWLMAYSARCEHALEIKTPWKRSRCRNWLRVQAPLLL